MTRYTATINGHALTRNTKRTYSHAWLISTKDGLVYASGFAASLELATKAAAAALPRDISARDKKNMLLRRSHASTAKHQGFANLSDWYAHIAKSITEQLARLETGFAPAVEAPAKAKG